MLDEITIFSDGSSLGNPGPGGFGVIMRWKDNEIKISEGFRKTTNNRMELMAAIKGLEALTRPCHVSLTTDSQYVRKGITEWIFNWRKNNWRTAAKKPVKNADLWQRLDLAVEAHQVQWHWVKGHSGHAENEIADELANLGAAEHSLTPTGK